MNNYVQPGNTITLTAPVGGVSAGDGVQIGQLFGVAVNDADAAADFELQTTGVFTLPKDATAAWTEGQPLYWDGSEVTGTAEGNLPIGCAASAADSADTTGNVRLNGTARPTFFKSAEQTGTGSSQNVAHGLGVVPSLVMIQLTEFADTLAVDVAEGTHTSTNVVVTVASGAKFIAYAWA